MKDTELISRWEDFGMKHRGRWRAETIYDENDVVSHVINGQEGHFVCKAEHIGLATPDADEDNWWEWDKGGRLKKKVHPHNLVQAEDEQ